MSIFRDSDACCGHVIVEERRSVLQAVQGYRLLKKRAKSVSFTYDAGFNRLNIKL
ncbi:hypothetical protein [Acetobacterium bakii]|uniref:hypothetical protein n=1 Tax=Acetobacterium bakii TaxID=52689 RepID=UPI001364CC7B|nr:hypothetical protein [Acetobacterium bakii]